MKFVIKSVSMDDVAKELHISKKTIYQYFKNKEDLISAMLQFYIENDHTSYLKSFANKDMNAIDELLLTSRWVCNNFKNVNPAHLFDLKKYYTRQFDDFWVKKREQVFDSIKANLERGIQEKVYRDSLNIDLIARLYALRLEDFHGQDGDFFGKYTFEEVFKTQFENHIRAICNSEGIKYFESKKDDYKQFFA